MISYRNLRKCQTCARYPFCRLAGRVEHPCPYYVPRVRLLKTGSDTVL